MNIEPVSAAISNISGVVAQVVSHYKNYQDLKADENAYMRLTYLEILHNLEILDTIKLGNLKSVKPNDPGFKDLIDQLSIEILSGVFAPGGNGKGKLYKFLREKGKVKSFQSKNDVDYGNEQPVAGEIQTTVLQSIAFLVTKIHVLKAASSVGEQEFMKRLLLSKRLKNIRERMLWIKATMRNYEVLDGMA